MIRTPVHSAIRDIAAGSVVFLVALPLCLGISLASHTPILSGVLAGIIGGILVGALSRSQISVSGPAAGLAAVVAAQIAALGSFPTFLMAVIIAGLIQIGLGIARAGALAAFFPSSVVKGLLAAIGIILILKQIPHLLGHNANPQGDLAFIQSNHSNTFAEFGAMIGHIHAGSAAIGIGSIALLALWSICKPLKASLVPAPLVAVAFGVAAAAFFRQLGGRWEIEPGNFVQVPVANGFSDFLGFLHHPDFSQWSNPAVYMAGLTIALVASLETLLNLEALDKIDPQQRKSPPNRELLAQGIGNLVAGLAGGIPIMSVIIRSAVNVHAGGRTKLATITHGVLLLVSIVLFPTWLNMIPLSSLAAILLAAGIRLASPKLVKRMWDEGRHQFIPFALTVAAIVLTDPLIGVLIGMATSAGFILNSSLRSPVRRTLEKHLGGEVLRVELANQVSFLNRAALSGILDTVPRNGHILLDAGDTDYIDPDILDLIRDFAEQAAPARGIEVSLLGFKEKYQLRDQIQYADYSSREIQGAFTPGQVLQLLHEGNERFRSGQRLTRNLGRQVQATADGQHPLAVILSCIDSRAPAELIFDLGVGDIFNIRVAGNISTPEVLGSMEYACAVAGAKLILVMGHTRCGAVTAAVDLAGSGQSAEQATGCQHLDPIVRQIQQSIDVDALRGLVSIAKGQKEAFVDATARRNVFNVADSILSQSQALAALHRDGKIAIVGAIYDVATGNIDFLADNRKARD